jgi:hypothetical protein
LELAFSHFRYGGGKGDPIVIPEKKHRTLDLETMYTTLRQTGWREHPHELSAKNSSPRVKKLSAKIKTLVKHFFTEAKKNSRRGIFHREQFAESFFLSAKNFF